MLPPGFHFFKFDISDDIIWIPSLYLNHNELLLNYTTKDGNFFQAVNQQPTEKDYHGI